MKTRELRRSESRDLSQRPGELAERIASEEYGYRNTPSDDFDGESDSGTTYECKSTASTLSQGQSGRFRLWKEQHTRLVRRDRNDSAYYIFVLFDVEERPPVARMKRKDPAKIGAIVRGRGGFYDSGHASKGQQHKLPIEAVFD